VPPAAVVPPAVRPRIAQPAALELPAPASQPATVSHTVYVVKANSRLWKTMLQPLLTKEVAADVTLEELAAKGILAQLGVVTFVAGKAKAQLPAGMKTLSDISWAGGAVKQPAIFFFQEARPPEQVKLMQRQTKAIQDAVGSASDVGQQAAPALRPPPGGSPILTFIQVEST
jgi:hypothetical protein